MLEPVSWDRESLVISLVERRVRQTVYGLRRSERYEGRRELKLL